jgi:hypothetical protein
MYVGEKQESFRCADVFAKRYLETSLLLHKTPTKGDPSEILKVPPVERERI